MNLVEQRATQRPKPPANVPKNCCPSTSKQRAKDILSIRNSPLKIPQWATTTRPKRSCWNWLGWDQKIYSRVIISCSMALMLMILGRGHLEFATCLLLYQLLRRTHRESGVCLFFMIDNLGSMYWDCSSMVKSSL